MGLYDAIKTAQNKSEDNLMFTENGAVVYSSIGSKMVDFNFAVNSMRNKSIEEIGEMFADAYAENPLMATKMMFQIGDIREGKGERHTFNSCMNYMVKKHPEIAKSLLPLIPEYTRWDYAIKLCVCENPQVAKAAREMVATQIKEDIENAKAGKSISLCAKWMPSIQSKKDEDRKLALKLEKVLKLDHKGYRKMLSELREKLNIIEKNMSQKTMENVDFENMTSKQQLKYADKLKETMGEEYNEYLKKVASGEATMNSGVNTPADIVHRYTKCDGWDCRLKPYDLALENLWNNLKDTIGDSVKGSTIVVRDGSGSMTTRVSGQTTMSCLEVATALSIYCAEKMQGELKDKFITFSSRPEVVDMSKLDTLHDKLELCYRHDDCSNTDLKKTFDLLLNTLKSGNVSQEEAPSSILIMSDMEFDYAHTGRFNNGSLVPLFDTIRQEWAEAGYKLPTLVFWQLNANRSPIPEINNELGLVLLSGFTTENLDLVMSGELAQYTPEKQLEIILSNERYNAVGDAFLEGQKKEREVQSRTPSSAREVYDYETRDAATEREKTTPIQSEEIGF